MTDSALIVVDMLHDFIDGSMACINSDQAVKEASAFIDRVTEGRSQDEDEILGGYPILFICDHHPSDHCSFTDNGGTWPAHCVQGTHGAEVHEALQPYMKDELTFYKGCAKEREQYSGFEGENSAGQSLGEVLELLDIKDVYVCGIATEYCVNETCSDLAKAGYNVHVITGALAYVDKDGHEKTLRQMGKAGFDLI